MSSLQPPAFTVHAAHAHDISAADVAKLTAASIAAKVKAYCTPHSLEVRAAASLRNLD